MTLQKEIFFYCTPTLDLFATLLNTPQTKNTHEYTLDLFAIFLNIHKKHTRKPSPYFTIQSQSKSQ